MCNACENDVKNRKGNNRMDILNFYILSDRMFQLFPFCLHDQVQLMLKTGP